MCCVGSQLPPKLVVGLSFPLASFAFMIRVVGLSAVSDNRETGLYRNCDNLKTKWLLGSFR